MKIAIVGAGLSGLTCADRLVSKGHQVTLFDKARGPGGRMSTRRLTTVLGDAYFDHGVQYFTVRDEAFKAVVEQWQTEGLAMPWPVAAADAWVGTPSMNSPVKWMANRHQVVWSARVEAIRPQDAGWRLIGEGITDTTFDAVVLAVPAEQAAVLLAPIDSVFHQLALSTPSIPCWTLMLAFAEPLAVRRVILRDDAVIRWAACNSSKPRRSGPHSWVVHAATQWSIEHLEESEDTVQRHLVQRFEKLIGFTLPEPLAVTVHRWRYAESGNIKQTALYNPQQKLGVCGDWMLGSRVECAWLSGEALGRMITD